MGFKSYKNDKNDINRVFKNLYIYIYIFFLPILFNQSIISCQVSLFLENLLNFLISVYVYLFISRRPKTWSSLIIYWLLL